MPNIISNFNNVATQFGRFGEIALFGAGVNVSRVSSADYSKLLLLHLLIYNYSTFCAKCNVLDVLVGLLHLRKFT